MTWAYLLVFLIAVATEILWIEAVDGVEKNNMAKVAFTAVAIPGINSFTVKAYVADDWAIVPMLAGHLVGALAAMLLKASRESRTGGPTTGLGSQSSDPS